LLIAAAAALIAFAASLAWISLRRGGTSDAKGKTIARLEVLRIALDEFYRTNQRYPTASEGLALLTSDASGILAANPPAQAIALDGWNRPFVYRMTGDARPVLYSIGANGVDEHGAGDDLTAAAGK
jgi:type II secretory pathway pseudopilin PulG